MLYSQVCLFVFLFVCSLVCFLQSCLCEGKQRDFVFFLFHGPNLISPTEQTKQKEQKNSTRKCRLLTSHLEIQYSVGHAQRSNCSSRLYLQIRKLLLDLWSFLSILFNLFFKSLFPKLKTKR